MFSFLPQVPFSKIITKYEVLLVCILLFTLSCLVFYQVLKTTQEKENLNLKLGQKEELVASLSARAKALLADYQSIKNDTVHTQLETINQVIDKYQVVKDKSATYKSQGVDTAAVDSQFPTAVDEILAAKYVEADALLTSLDNSLESALKTKLAADAAAAAAAAKKSTTTTSSTSSTCSSLPSSGYCRTSVNGFTVDVIVASVSSVITDTANGSDCSNNCPTKSLSSYVADNGGFGGINGTYFCPPDYASCSGKTNSYDFPVYNSNINKWLNYGNILWDNRAMLAFTSTSAVFYQQASSYSGLSGLKAAIVNFPGLVYNGANIVGSYSLTSAQQTKGYRGGIAVKGSSVYLVVARSATVPDLANIMVSLGVTHALNLDGGGSTALFYQGSYKLGPGRSLPNAIILK